MQRGSQDPTTSSARVGSRASWQASSPSSKAKAVPEIWRPGASPDVRPAASRTLAHASALLGADDSGSRPSGSVQPDDPPHRDFNATSIRGKAATPLTKASDSSRDSLSSAKNLSPSAVRRAVSQRLAESPQIWKPGTVSKSSSSTATPSGSPQAPRVYLGRSVSSSASISHARSSSHNSSYTLSIAKDVATDTQDRSSGVHAAPANSKPKTPAAVASDQTTVPSQSMATTLAKKLNELQVAAEAVVTEVRRTSNHSSPEKKALEKSVTSGAREHTVSQVTNSTSQESLSRSPLRSASRSARRESRGKADPEEASRSVTPTHTEKPLAPPTTDDKVRSSKDADSAKREARRASHVSSVETKEEEEQAALKKAEAERKAAEAREQEAEVKRQEDEERRKEEKRKRKKELKRKEDEARKKQEEAKRKEDEARKQAEEVRLKEVEIARREEELRRREEEWVRREAEVLQAQLNREEEKSRRKTEELRRLEEGMRMWQRAMRKTEEDLQRREEEYRRYQAERPQQGLLQVQAVLDEVWRLRQEESLQWLSGV